MYKVAICDDVIQVCALIEDTLLAYGKENGIRIQTEVFYDGESLSAYMNKGNTFDLIYLDIEMGTHSGIDVSRDIRYGCDDIDTEIVFVSGTSQYDRELFDMHPLHFIPKPVDPQLVIRDLKLAMKKHNCAAGVFTFKHSQETVRLKYADILYLESFDRKIAVTTTQKTYEYYGKLSDAAAEVPGFFCRIYRSYIINLRRVSAFRSDSVTMEDGKALPVSESCRKEYREKQKKEMMSEDSL